MIGIAGYVISRMGNAVSFWDAEKCKPAQWDGLRLVSQVSPKGVEEEESRRSTVIVFRLLSEARESFFFLQVAGSEHSD